MIKSDNFLIIKPQNSSRKSNILLVFDYNWYKSKGYELWVLCSIIVKGGLVNVVENYVNKGQEIAVEGKLTNRSYDTKEGEKRYVTEILVNELLMLGGKYLVGILLWKWKSVLLNRLLYI